MKIQRRTLSLILLLMSAPVAALAPRVCSAQSAADADNVQFFETRVRPLLIAQCYSCHSAGAKKLKGGLYLDSRDGLLKGGDSGAAMVPGQPGQSRIIEAITWTNPDLQMPPKTKLADDQVGLLREWVRRGAVWPADKTDPAGPRRPVFDLQKRRSEHWAWQPIRRPRLPEVKNAAWPREPIDRFILAKLESAGLSPAAEADRRTFIRRATFDLTGLPPAPQQVQAFLDDSSPSAFQTLIDRLLASPAFGERWARHWLDLVHYAETRGHEFDYDIPNAWRYRDYVIRAFNADVPYDQLLTEHLAGDLLELPRLNPGGGFNESILGTGFWHLGEEIHSPVDIRQDEADRMNNRLDTMTKTFLGLTVGCARCHDHKFDAISTKDYYSLTGVLLSSAYRQVPFESLEQNRGVAVKLADLRQTERPALLRQLIDAEQPGIDRTAEYLLTARDTRTTMLASTQPSQQQLDVKVMTAWAAELHAASLNPAHPLYAPARILLGLKTHRRGEPTRLISSSAAPDGNVSPAVRVLADYSKPGTPLWQDGFSFGIAPARAGELDLGPAGIGIVPFSAVRRDPAWPNIVTIQSETDAGVLGTFDRPGRTFRTPKVTLTTGRIWYRVRGAGQTYAAVDSHLIVHGPLHGRLLHRFDTRGKWAWVPQDLSEYEGQRVEFEFTPADDSPLAVSTVVESEQLSQEPHTLVRDPLDLATTSEADVGSPDSCAAAVQAALVQVADLVAADKLLASPDADAVAPLADWLIRHSDLFIEAGSPQRRVFDDATAEALHKQAGLISQVKVQSPTAPAMFDGNGVDENVLVRGVAHNPGDVTPRRFLEAIAGDAQPAYPSESSGRLRLAHDMLSTEDPFPARVMANRVWQHLMGTGIVPTVDNFGVLGQPPTHPELLDYLADTFRTEQSWSIKKLIRSIMLSSTYRMSSFPSADAEKTDPQDALLHRMPVRRLESEAIRDAILAVSGRLDSTVGGPSIDVHLTEFMEGRGRPGGGPLDGNGRRSIYIRLRRNFMSPMMLAYDSPIPFATMGRRSVSNVPAQALILMNDPFVIGEAKVWADRVLAAGPRPARQRIAQMYQEAFSRPPTEAELADAEQFLDDAASFYELAPGRGADDPRVWADYAHVLFNVKEFIFVK